MTEQRPGIMILSRPIGGADLDRLLDAYFGDIWSCFTTDQQILMIGNEMNRAAKLMAPDDRPHLVNCYERILHLTDLTIAIHERKGLRRELLRWRDLIAAMFVSGESQPDDHAKAFRCLLYLTPEASKQIPFCHLG